jgi:hypothetical protein
MDPIVQELPISWGKSSIDSLLAAFADWAHMDALRENIRAAVEASMRQASIAYESAGQLRIPNPAILISAVNSTRRYGCKRQELAPSCSAADDADDPCSRRSARSAPKGFRRPDRDPAVLLVNSTHRLPLTLGLAGAALTSLTESLCDSEAPGTPPEPLPILSPSSAEH